MLEDSDVRRTLGQRILRLLTGLERAKRQPTRREVYHVRHAIERLQAEQYPEADAAILKAERSAPLPDHVAGLLATNEAVPVDRLREELHGVLTVTGPGKTDTLGK